MTSEIPQLMGLAATHSEGKQNTLTSQSVSGIDVSSTALLRDSRSRSTSFSVAATKNIPTLFAKLGADGSYSFGSGEQAISSSMGGGQEGATVIDTRTNSYALHGNATITPVPRAPCSTPAGTPGPAPHCRIELLVWCFIVVIIS